MKVTSKDKQLQLALNDSSKVLKMFGPVRGKLLMLRVRALIDAETLEEVKYLPGHFHELVGDRKGLWACNLDQPYRLIFEPHEDPIPEDENGKYIWLEIKGVELIEITNYHGK